MSSVVEACAPQFPMPFARVLYNDREFGLDVKCISMDRSSDAFNGLYAGGDVPWYQRNPSTALCIMDGCYDATACAANFHTQSETGLKRRNPGRPKGSRDKKPRKRKETMTSKSPAKNLDGKFADNVASSNPDSECDAANRSASDQQSLFENIQALLGRQRASMVAISSERCSRQQSFSPRTPGSPSLPQSDSTATVCLNSSTSTFPCFTSSYGVNVSNNLAVSVPCWGTMVRSNWTASSSPSLPPSVPTIASDIWANDGPFFHRSASDPTSGHPRVGFDEVSATVFPRPSDCELDESESESDGPRAISVCSSRSGSVSGAESVSSAGGSAVAGSPEDPFHSDWPFW